MTYSREIKNLEKIAARIESDKQLRLSNIRSAAAKGASIRVIATAARLSPSRVHQIIREEEANDGNA